MNDSKKETPASLQSFLSAVAACGAVIVVLIIFVYMVLSAPSIIAWMWGVAEWMFWGTIGSPFWWLSFHTGATPFAPGAVLAAYALFCILCIKNADMFEAMVCIGCGYAVLFVIGFMIRFL